MDVSLEIINVLKSMVELHVLIELTQGSKNENIINIETLPEEKVFVGLEKLRKLEYLTNIKRNPLQQVLYYYTLLKYKGLIFK
jgi:hypothetical protein